MGALACLVAGYGALFVTAGSTDSPLRPPLPSGAAVPAWAARAARWIGLDRVSRAGLTALDLALLLALVLAFVVVLREAWAGRVRTAAVVVAASFSLTLSVAAPLVLSRDVHSYAVYGRIYSVHGANPYVSAPSTFPSDPFVRVASTEWLNARSRYGPAFELPSAGIARLWVRSAGATILVFKVLAGVAVALACLFAHRACRRLRPGREAAAVAALGLNPVIVVHTVGGGHNDALIAALLAAALALVARMLGTDEPGDDSQRWNGWPAIAVTALLTVAALIKVIAALALAAWLWSIIRASRTTTRPRTLARHALTVFVISALLFAPFVSGWHTATPLVSPGSLQGWASGPHLLAKGAGALAQAVAGAGSGSSLASSMGTAVTVVFLAAFALAYWKLLRKATPELAPTLWGASLLLFALSGPYLLPWYAAWFLPFAALFSDDVLTLIALGVAGVLALTGVPAEPGTDPRLYQGMLLAVHYGAAPVMLGALGLAAGRVLSHRPGGQSSPPDTRMPVRTPVDPVDPTQPAGSA
jgi:hypothetical protein